jgi:hypothetical protein
MPHSPLAATTAAKRRGNPDLNLAPRCGARTRGGCACRAPAVRGRLRCRMHGGRSTGPRTEAGMARLRAARTVHGRYGAETRAFNRYTLTMLRRGRVGNEAVRCLDRLPAEFAARLAQMPPELLPPTYPTAGLTVAEDRAVLRAEAEALAPWKAAIAWAKAHAPVRAARAERRGWPAFAGHDGKEGPACVGHDGRGAGAAGQVRPAEDTTRPHATEPGAFARSACSAVDTSLTAPAQPPLAQSLAAPAAEPRQPHAAKPHATERAADAAGLIAAALPNRSERRRLKSLQRRLLRNLPADLRP